MGGKKKKNPRRLNQENLCDKVPKEWGRCNTLWNLKPNGPRRGWVLPERKTRKKKGKKKENMTKVPEGKERVASLALVRREETTFTLGSHSSEKNAYMSLEGQRPGVEYLVKKLTDLCGKGNWRPWMGSG